jgi:uncharacterized membrane protein
MKRRMTRGMFAAAVAAAMGFGAAQAVAAPSAEAQAVRGCTQESCEKRCAPLIGFCEPRGCWCR